jgi:hypothetical protein
MLLQKSLIGYKETQASSSSENDSNQEKITKPPWVSLENFGISLEFLSSAQLQKEFEAFIYAEEWGIPGCNIMYSGNSQEFSFLLGLLSDHDNGGDIFLWKAGLSSDYAVLQAISSNSAQSPPSELQHQHRIA